MAIISKNIARDETLIKLGIGRIRSQRLFDLQSTKIYIGFSPPGTATDAAGWTIKRIMLDETSGDPISEQWTDEDVAVWDNRESEVYS